MAVELDDILKDVGNYGKAQKIMIWTIFVPLTFLISFSLNTVLFQTIVPDHWCHVPKTNSSISSEAWKNMTIPRSSAGEFESCLRYKKEDFYLPQNKKSNNTAGCDSGWDFDDSKFESTVATTWNWFCDKEIYSKHALSVRFVGGALGSTILPVIADKYTGRRLVLFISMAIRHIFILALPWVPWPKAYIALSFFTSLPSSIIYQMCYIIVLELLAADKRSYVSSLSFFSWSTGMAFTSLFSWMFPNWKILAVSSLIPLITIIPMWFYLPESPRWLILKGRKAEAKEVMYKLSCLNEMNVNKKSIDERIDEITINEEDKAPFLSILKHKRILICYVILSFLGISSYIADATLILNLTVFPNQYFLNFFILSIVELPSNFTGWLGTQYLGRRATTSLSFLFASFFSILAVSFIKETTILMVIIAILKLLACQAMYSYYLFIPEILPTPIRSAGMGFIDVISCLSMVICPYIIPPNVSEVFPYWFVGGWMFIAGLSSIYLPETLGLSLPQTFNDAEKVFKIRPFFSFVHHWNKNDYTLVNTNENACEIANENASDCNKKEYSLVSTCENITKKASDSNKSEYSIVNTSENNEITSDKKCTSADDNGL